MGLKGGACDVPSDDWSETTTGPSVPWMSINPGAWHESKCSVGPTRATAELLLPRGKLNDVAVGEPECSNVQVVLFWTLTYLSHVPLIHLVFRAALECFVGGWDSRFPEDIKMSQESRALFLPNLTFGLGA